MTRSEAHGFHVTTTRKKIVVAAAPPPPLSLPENLIIPLSNLDLLLPLVDINVCFFYKKPLYDITLRMSVFGSYHLPAGSRTGYVMTMPSPVVDDGAGDWRVYLHLTKAQLKFIEQEASHVFNPVDNDYLKI